MNEEEMRAFNTLKEEYEKMEKCNNVLFPLYKHDTKRLINIIEKQQKEIEKLHKTLDDDIGNIVNLGYLLSDNAKNKKDVSCYIDECQIFFKYIKL